MVQASAQQQGRQRRWPNDTHAAGAAQRQRGDSRAGVRCQRSCSVARSISAATDKAAERIRVHAQVSARHAQHGAISRHRQRGDDLAERRHAAEEPQDAEGAENADDARVLLRDEEGEDGHYDDEGVYLTPHVRDEGPKPVSQRVDGELDGKDDGEYTIVLLGKYEKKCSANLNVRAAPRIFLDNDFKDNIVIKRGQTLEMEVNYRGYPEPKLNWSFDDEPLRPDNRTRIENFKNI